MAYIAPFHTNEEEFENKNDKCRSEGEPGSTARKG